MRPFRGSRPVFKSLRQFVIAVCLFTSLVIHLSSHLTFGSRLFPAPPPYGYRQFPYQPTVSATASANYVKPVDPASFAPPGANMRHSKLSNLGKTIRSHAHKFTSRLSSSKHSNTRSHVYSWQAPTPYAPQYSAPQHPPQYQPYPQHVPMNPVYASPPVYTPSPVSNTYAESNAETFAADPVEPEGPPARFEQPIQVRNHVEQETYHEPIDQSAPAYNYVAPTPVTSFNHVAPPSVTTIHHEVREEQHVATPYLHAPQAELVGPPLVAHSAPVFSQQPLEQPHEQAPLGEYKQPMQPLFNEYVQGPLEAPRRELVENQSPEVVGEPLVGASVGETRLVPDDGNEDVKDTSFVHDHNQNHRQVVIDEPNDGLDRQSDYSKPEFQPVMLEQSELESELNPSIATNEAMIGDGITPVDSDFGEASIKPETPFEGSMSEEIDMPYERPSKRRRLNGDVDYKQWDPSNDNQQLSGRKRKFDEMMNGPESVVDETFVPPPHDLDEVLESTGETDDSTSPNNSVPEYEHAEEMLIHPNSELGEHIDAPDVSPTVPSYKQADNDELVSDNVTPSEPARIETEATANSGPAIPATEGLDKNQDIGNPPSIPEKAEQELQGFDVDPLKSDEHQDIPESMKIGDEAHLSEHQGDPAPFEEKLSGEETVVPVPSENEHNNKHSEVKTELADDVQPDVAEDVDELNETNAPRTESLVETEKVKEVSVPDENSKGDHEEVSSHTSVPAAETSPSPSQPTSAPAPAPVPSPIDNGPAESSGSNYAPSEQPEVSSHKTGEKDDEKEEEDDEDDDGDGDDSDEDDDTDESDKDEPEDDKDEDKKSGNIEQQEPSGIISTGGDDGHNSPGESHKSIETPQPEKSPEKEPSIDFKTTPVVPTQSENESKSATVPEASISPVVSDELKREPSQEEPTETQTENKPNSQIIPGAEVPISPNSVSEIPDSIEPKASNNQPSSEHNQTDGQVESPGSNPTSSQDPNGTNSSSQGLSGVNATPSARSKGTSSPDHTESSSSSPTSPESDRSPSSSSPLSSPTNSVSNDPTLSNPKTTGPATSNPAPSSPTNGAAASSGPKETVPEQSGPAGSVSTPSSPRSSTPATSSPSNRSAGGARGSQGKQVVDEINDDDDDDDEDDDEDDGDPDGDGDDDDEGDEDDDDVADPEGDHKESRQANAGEHKTKEPSLSHQTNPNPSNSNPSNANPVSSTPNSSRPETSSQQIDPCRRCNSHSKNSQPNSSQPNSHKTASQGSVDPNRSNVIPDQPPVGSQPTSSGPSGSVSSDPTNTSGSSKGSSLSPSNSVSSGLPSSPSLNSENPQITSQPQRSHPMNSPTVSNQQAKSYLPTEPGPIDEPGLEDAATEHLAAPSNGPHNQSISNRDKSPDVAEEKTSSQVSPNQSTTHKPTNSSGKSGRTSDHTHSNRPQPTSNELESDAESTGSNFIDPNDIHHPEEPVEGLEEGVGENEVEEEVDSPVSESPKSIEPQSIGAAGNPTATDRSPTVSDGSPSSKSPTVHLDDEVDHVAPPALDGEPVHTNPGGDEQRPLSSHGTHPDLDGENEISSNPSDEHVPGDIPNEELPSTSQPHDIVHPNDDVHPDDVVHPDDDIHLDEVSNNEASQDPSRDTSSIESNSSSSSSSLPSSDRDDELSSGTPVESNPSSGDHPIVADALPSPGSHTSHPVVEEEVDEISSKPVSVNTPIDPTPDEQPPHSSHQISSHPDDEDEASSRPKDESNQTSHTISKSSPPPLSSHSDHPDDEEEDEVSSNPSNIDEEESESSSDGSSSRGTSSSSSMPSSDDEAGDDAEEEVESNLVDKESVPHEDEKGDEDIREDDDDEKDHHEPPEGMDDPHENVDSKPENSSRPSRTQPESSPASSPSSDSSSSPSSNPSSDSSSSSLLSDDIRSSGDPNAVNNRARIREIDETPLTDEHQVEPQPEATTPNKSVPESEPEPDATSEEIKAELADRPLPPMLDQDDLEQAKDRVFGAGKTNTNRNRITKLNHMLAIKDDDWKPRRELEILNEGINPEKVSSSKSDRPDAKKIFREKILPLGRKIPKEQARVKHFLASAKKHPKLKPVHYNKADH